MDEDQANQQQNQLDGVQETTTLPQQQPSYVPPDKQKSKKKLLTLILVLFIAITAACAWYLVIFTSEDATDVNQKAEDIQDDVANNREEAGLPQFLIDSNQGSNGVAIGYIEKTVETSSSSFFIPKASAQEVEYESVIFYQKDSNIYSLNTISKETEQVTQDGGTTPAFSTRAQKLAYNNGCDTLIKDYRTGETLVVVEGEDSADTSEFNAETVCYSPVAWSPNGQTLLLAGTYSLNNTNIGLVSFTDLYVFEQTESTVSKLDAPSGYNSIPSIYDALWINNQEILTTYIDRGAFAVENARQAYIVSVVNKDFQPVSSEIAIVPNETKFFGDSIVSLGEAPRELLYTASGTINELQKIPNTETTGTYLIEVQNNSLRNFYTLDGYAGEENSFSLNKITVDGTKNELYRPGGFSAYMLGWGLGYDEIIYMSGQSGKSEIRQYTISTNTDEVLVADLPLQ